MKVPDALLPLFAYGIIQEVIRPLMSGKEASVFLVQTVEGVKVAKVYKEANNRSFRQRADYTEGRTVRSSRQRRAMAKGSRYGKSLLEEAWQNAEVEALHRLHRAGVRVPVPFHSSEDVLVMELIADAEGNPAPRLWDVCLVQDEAIALHKRLVREVVRMLCAGMVHGDLSEYNILLTAEEPVIIDFPQATDAAHNRNSERLLKRDVKNLANYFGRFAPRVLRTRYDLEIWDLYERGVLHPDTPLTGKFFKKDKEADVNAVLAEIQAVAMEEADRPMSAYAEKKARKAEQRRLEAERMDAEEARRTARRAAAPKEGPREGPKDGPKDGARGRQAPEGEPGKKRRRRRRRGGPRGGPRQGPNKG